MYQNRARRLSSSRTPQSYNAVLRAFASQPSVPPPTSPSPRMHPPAFDMTPTRYTAAHSSTLARDTTDRRYHSRIIARFAVHRCSHDVQGIEKELLRGPCGECGRVPVRYVF